MPHRASIPKSVRFEVFKRDSFKCQYCGAGAPEVLLHIDHMTPVAAGGASDLLNLITSCVACNLGKSDRSLDDSTAVSKSRAQLEELQARREQLEMMMQWRQGLRSLKDDTVDAVIQYWEELTPGWSVNDKGREGVRKWVRKFTVDEVLYAMDVAADQYLKLGPEDRHTEESWEKAWSRIPRICAVERECRENPGVRDLYLIRGTLRNRLSYVRDADCLELLKVARSWDVSVDDLRRLASSVSSWTRFCTEVEQLIEDRRTLTQGTNRG